MDQVTETNPTEPTTNKNRKGAGAQSRQRGNFQKNKNKQFQAELQASILKRLKISDPTNLDDVQLQKSSPPQQIPITLMGLPIFVKELWERMKAIGTRPFASLATDDNRDVFLKCLLYIAETRVCYAQLTCGRNPVFQLTSLQTYSEMQLRSIRAYSSRLPTPLVIYMEAIGNITANKQYVVPVEMTTTPPAANGAVSFFPSSITTLLTTCTADNPTDGLLMNVAQRLSGLPKIVWVMEQRHCPAISATATSPAQPERNFEVAHISPDSRNFWRFPNNTEWTIFNKIIASMESKKDFLLQFDVSSGLGSLSQIVRFPDEFDSTETETLYYNNVDIPEFDEKLSGALLLGLEHGSNRTGRFTSSYDECLSHGSISQNDVRHAVIWANN